MSHPTQPAVANRQSRRGLDHTGPGGLLGFLAAAAIVGALTGLVAASFRIALELAAQLRLHAQSWAQLRPALGWPLIILASAAATALAAWLVRRVEPHAEGSGIPRVEAVVEGRTPAGRRRILPVKYVGGILAIGSGLALGREGPSVQMGGNVAVWVARMLRRSDHDLRVLVAAGAGAGLATAFNAPIAGGVFVLEELVKKFDQRTTLATLTACAAGFATSHLFVRGYDFAVPPVPEPTLRHAPSVLAVGLLTGLLGAAYNRLVMRGMRWADTSRIPREVRAAVIGAGVAVVGLCAPSLVGGGDNLTSDALAGRGTIGVVLGVLAARVVLGVISYAACTPGGLFAPMLVLGSDSGLLVGLVGAAVLPGMTASGPALAVVGFASFFAATVRAPITGIVLATEMTGSVAMLAPMLGACAVAMLIATLLRTTPIYDALTARAAHNARLNARDEAA